MSDETGELLQLRAEMALLRAALVTLTAEVATLREIQTSLVAREGRPTWGSVSLAAGLLFTIALQIGVGLYWGGEVKGTQEMVVSMLRQHMAQDKDGRGEVQHAPPRDKW